MGARITRSGGGKTLLAASIAGATLLGLGTATSRSEELLSLQQSPSSASVDNLANLSLEDLMNLEVTSVSKSRQRIGDAPAAVTVITQDDIQRSGLREIPELLRLAPGVFVQRGTQFTTWTVAARGLPYDFNNNLLVLQDGRSIYYPIFGGVVWNTVDYPIADLDRIEVIRGPGATLWGANALNGVINITSKSARDTQGTLIDTRASSDDSDVAVRHGGKLDPQTYYRVYAKARYIDDLNTPGDVDANYGLTSSSGGFRIDRYPSDTDQFTLQGDAFAVTGENSLILPMFVPPFGGGGDSTNDFRGGNILARWTHTDSSTSQYSLQAYFDFINIDAALQREHISTFDVDFQHHLQLAQGNELIYGIGGRYQPFGSDPTGSGLSSSDPLGINWASQIDLCMLSTFAQDTITLIPERLKLTLGSKLEYNSLSGFEVQPSGRLLFTPDERTSIWGAVSRAVRTPGLDNRTFHMPVAVFPNNSGTLTEITFAGNHKNDSEHLLAYELGLRKQITHAWSVDVAGFLDEHQDLLVAQGAAPVFQTQPVPHLEVINRDINGADVENYGVEISTSAQLLSHWRVSGSYSLLISNVVNQDPNINFGGTYYEGPQHQFQAHSWVDLTRNLQFNTSFYWVDSAQSGAIPAYGRLDANLTWTPQPGLDVQIGVQNAVNPEHPEFLHRSGPQAEIEAAVYGQITCRF